IRRECLDHMIIINEAHLRQVLRSYSLYYHRSRTHLGFEKDAPDHRPVSETSTGQIVSIPEVDGLHYPPSDAHRQARAPPARNSATSHGRCRATSRPDVDAQFSWS